MAEPKLTKAQQRVMAWLSQGWEATQELGMAVYINGQRVCNLDTMTVLERKGLVENYSRWRWRATEAGRALKGDR